MELTEIARLPTRYGTFEVRAAREDRTGREHLVLQRGEIAGGTDVPVRLHSECLTGDVLGSRRCDCRDQLEAALGLIEAAGRGVLIYLRQEGRGIGLVNKIRAYRLQDQGLDTVEANRRLGFEDDPRNYDFAVEVLRALAIESVALITNNPAKIEGLRAGGVEISRTLPLVIAPTPDTAGYLEAKAARLGHRLGAGAGTPSRPGKGRPDGR